MNEQPTILKTYRVRVGFAQVEVKARDVQQAVTIARQKLSQELPRLYDVIRALAPAKFEIEYAA